MSGPTITVQLDVAAVAGLLSTTDALIKTLRDHDLPDLVAEQVSMQLALKGALRAQGWVPVGDHQWEHRPQQGRRR